jgi:hypothetical protein
VNGEQNKTTQSPGKSEAEREEEMLTSYNKELASEYLRMLQRHGSVAALRGQKDDLGEETIVRVYSQDRSYRSVRVRREDTAATVVANLRAKLGANEEELSRFSLYKFQYENERLVQDDAVIFDLIKQNKKSAPPILWIFKEVPDSEAFAELANVLPKLEQRGISLKTNRPAVEEWTRILLKKHLSVVTALCAVGEQDKNQDRLITALVKFFGHNKSLLSLFEKLATVEVARTVSVNNLFIGSSITAKLMSVYGKLVGRDYLRTVLTPALRLIYLYPDPLELDPARVDQEAIPGNVKQLQVLAELVLKTIYENIDAIPMNFRIICRRLHKRVVSSFPSMGREAHVLVRSFMFGKFICPAIVSPVTFGVVDTPPTTRGINRTLVLLSKTIHSLVNGVRFGQREPYMSSMNAFIEENKDCAELAMLFDAILDIEEKNSSKRSRVLALKIVGPARFSTRKTFRSLSAYATSSSIVSKPKPSGSGIAGVSIVSPPVNRRLEKPTFAKPLPPIPQSNTNTNVSANSWTANWNGTGSGSGSGSASGMNGSPGPSTVFSRVTRPIGADRRSMPMQSIGSARNRAKQNAETTDAQPTNGLICNSPSSPLTTSNPSSPPTSSVLGSTSTSLSNPSHSTSSSNSLSSKPNTKDTKEYEGDDFVEEEDFKLSESELEETLSCIYEYVNTPERFRLVGEAMNILPSPPWSEEVDKATTNGIPETDDTVESKEKEPTGSTTTISHRKSVAPALRVLRRKDKTSTREN